MHLSFAILFCGSANAAWPHPRQVHDSKIPPSFDCSMRKLAYQFGQQLLPRKNKFESLYYALDLNDPCDGDGAAPFEMAPDPSYAPRAVIRPATDAVYVSPNGDDSATGIESAPLKTIQKALDTAVSSKKLAVVLRKGTYYLPEALLIRAQHSGIAVTAYPNETPIISGGKALELAWKPYNVTKPGNGSWTTMTDDNIVDKAKVDNKTITDYGKTADAAACQTACNGHTGCTGYTWHDQHQGEKYKNLCRLRLDGEHPYYKQTGHTSGWKDINPGMNVWVADLHGQVGGVGVPGLQFTDAKTGRATGRATRARYPNLPGGIEVSCGYDCMVPSSSASWVPPDMNKYGNVTYFTDKTHAHYRNDTTPTGKGSAPNEPWFAEYMIGTRGLCEVYDPPVSYWCSERPSGGGAFAFRTPSGIKPKTGALPNSPYKDPSTALFNIWRPSRWANWMFDVGKAAGDGTITFGKGGNQGARGNDKGGDWFVENVAEELDFPGEYFYDAKASKLYLFYNATSNTPPPADGSVGFVATQIPTLVNVSGTQSEPVRKLSFSGITFTATRYTYMGPHGVPSAGDWALDRTAAVFLQGTEGVSFTDCRFERLDGNAVMVSGYNRNATVKDSDFEFIGGNAVAAWGYTNETENSGFPYYTPNSNYPEGGVDGTDGNHPVFTTITGCLAREVGHYEKQSSFFVQAKTAQSVITGNVFFNGPRAGINANDGTRVVDEQKREGIEAGGEQEKEIPRENTPTLSMFI